MNLDRRIRLASEGFTGDQLVLRADDIRWLTNFSGSTSCAVLHRDTARVSLLVDGRYFDRAQEESGQLSSSIDVVLVPSEVGVDETIKQVLRSEVLNVSPEDLTVARAKILQEKMTLQFVSHSFTTFRRVKDSHELSLIEQCAQIADQAIEALLAEGIEGDSELQVAFRLDSYMHKFGAHGVSFDTIVATGPNAARPHHEPSDAVIRNGHMVVIDFGAELHGYRSDMTRTVQVGDTSSEMREMFEIVRQAQTAGVQAVCHGVLGSSVDAAVRQVFADAGVEHEYVHGTGHGIGLIIHEEPILSPRCTALLQEGEVVTVEPGLYRKGVGGVRIEDLVVVTGTGCRILTHTPKDLSCPRSPQTI